MRKARWLADWSQIDSRPALYHCVSRVVDRQRVLRDEEKERFRELMRRYEQFSGCRVVSYCLMDDHFHLLLEVPPPSPSGITDPELLDRIAAIYPQEVVEKISAELEEAQRGMDAGEEGAIRYREDIHARFAPRMHNLSQFMKSLLQSYTQWHNRKHRRRGTLWEDRFKSVIIESGIAARTLATYIDLNPVRAGIVQVPEDYRWSSFGEAIGDSGQCGSLARGGLVRAWQAHLGVDANPALWRGDTPRPIIMLCHQP